MFHQPYNPAVYVRSSKDGGRTWGPVIRVDDDAHEAMWDPRSYPVVGGDGTLYVMYDASPFHTPSRDECCKGDKPSIALAISRDGGRTFTRTVVQKTTNPPSPPDEAEPYFTEFIPAIATDTHRPGRVAIAWPEDIKGESRILLRSSIDGGASWTEPTARFAWDPWWRSRTGPQDATTGHRGSMPSEYLGATGTRAGVWVSWDEMNGTYPDNMLRLIPISALR